MLSIITLPVDFISDISSNASTLITDLSDVITLIIGILLATIVLSLIVSAIRG